MDTGVGRGDRGGRKRSSTTGRRRWTEGQVITQIVNWVDEHGRYPGRNDLRRAGRANLEAARQRLFRGRHDELHAIVESRVGRPLQRQREASGVFDDESTLRLLLRPLCEALGRFPSRRQIEAELPAGVYQAIVRRGGLEQLAIRMDCQYVGPKRLTDEAALRLFRRHLRGNVSVATVRSAFGAAGLTMVYRKWGSIGALRRALHVLPLKGSPVRRSPTV